MKILQPAVLFFVFFVPATVLTAHGRSGESQPNVLLICIDDLRPELHSFGVDYIQSPNIDALAASGRAFQHHYVQAPTCGASRFALLTGTYGPAGNGALFGRANLIRHPSFPAWFRNNGYTAVSIGKVSHHPGGRGGADWNDDANPEMPDSWDQHLLPAGPWLHPRGAMHGLANGEIRKDAATMDLFQSFDGPDTAYPDGLITDESLDQLDQLANGERSSPFFLAIGIIRPHLPFGAPAKYMQPYVNAKLPPIAHPTKPAGKTTWHGSGEFMHYNRWGRDPNSDVEFADSVRKHYAACVTYADAQVGRIMSKLDELKLRDNTIIILWGDHGWHLGEHAIWGKHSLFEESLRSPLIISYPGMNSPGTHSNSIIETIDIFPTIVELAGLPHPEFVEGTSLLPILENPDQPGRSAISYTSNAQTIRTSKHRLIVHQGGQLELYDETTEEGETCNIASEQPGTTNQLLAQLRTRLKSDVFNEAPTKNAADPHKPAAND